MENDDDRGVLREVLDRVPGLLGGIDRELAVKPG
jgi:hypothetical protein